MCEQDLEPPLLFALERLLIGEQLLGDRFGVKAVLGDPHILPHNRNPIVPASVLRSVEVRANCRNLQDTSKLLFLFEHREVVLLEQPDELIRIPPPRFVVVLNHVGLCLASVGSWIERRLLISFRGLHYTTS